MDTKAGRSGDDRENPGGAARKRPAADEDSGSSSSDNDAAASPRRGGGDDRPDQSAMSRSERKRHREKKRRSDVNKGFDELMSLLIEVDPEVRAESEERSRRGLWKGSLGAPQDDNMLSRVDLISRTVSVLRRINSENEQRKALISQLLLQRAVGPGMDHLGGEAPRLGSLLSDSRQYFVSSGTTPISTSSPSLSHLVPSLPPYNAATALSHLSFNHLVAARQAQTPSALESLLGLGSQPLISAAGLGQPQGSQFSVTPEQLLALRLLQEQERQNNVASRQRGGRGGDPDSRGGHLGR